MNHATTTSAEPVTSRTWSALQVRTIGLCFILNMVDGADVLVVSYAAAGIAQEWGLAATTLGLLFSNGLAGMMAGSILVAPLADYFGRKNVILAVLALITLSMLASGYSPNIETLIVLRFLVGIGIGSMLASIAVLTSEFAPDRYRNFAVMFTTAGYSLGAVLLGLVAVATLEIAGWRSLFILLGAASGLILLLCFSLLPESMAFLATRRPWNALPRLNRMRRAMNLPELAELPVQAAGGTDRTTVFRLLDREFRRDTLFLWLTLFTAYITLYFLVSWIPKSLSDAGFTIETATLAGTIFNLGALAGIPALSLLTLRFELRRVISGGFLCAIAIMLAISLTKPADLSLLVAMFLLGFLTQGGFSGMWAVATRLYPATIRSTGVGWAVGIGRFGAIAGPYLGGVLIAAQSGFHTNLAVFTLPLAIAALAVCRVRLE